MFYLFVNGNRVHDEGDHDAQGRVTRAGGGPLTFETLAEGEDVADARHAANLERFNADRLGRNPKRAPRRESYVVSEDPPTVTE